MMHKQTRFLFLSSALLILTAGTAEASGISYSYMNLKASFDWYTGKNYGDESVGVHEILLNDSSGELSASLQSLSNQVAAQAGAENEERRKVNAGESLGGPKVISYSWQKEIPQDGDTKIYGLRIGSNDNPISMDPFSNDKGKDGLVTFVELSMIGGISQSILQESDSLLTSGTWFWGMRFGGLNSNDFSRTETRERSMETSYFHLPLTYRVKTNTSVGAEFWIEGGGDVITLVRHFGSKADRKIPLDTIVAAGVGYRLENQFNFGLKYEQYSGSLLSGWGKGYKYVNPDYKHTLAGAYLAYGF